MERPDLDAVEQLLKHLKAARNMGETEAWLDFLLTYCRELEEQYQEAEAANRTFGDQAKRIAELEAQNRLLRMQAVSFAEYLEAKEDRQP